MKGELSGNTLYLYFLAHLHPDDDDIGELSECFRLIDSKNENEKTLSSFDEYHFDLSDKFTDKFAIFSNGVNMVYVTAAGVAVKPAGEDAITSLSLVMEDGSSRDIVGGNIGISPDAVTVKSQTAQIYYYEPEDLIEYDKVTKVIVNGVEYSRPDIT